MTKLDWEKQNRIEIVGKRIGEYLDGKIVQPSKHEDLLKTLGLPISLECIDAVETSLSELKKEIREMRIRVDRNVGDDISHSNAIKKFLADELKNTYTGLVVLRLLALNPHVM